jgi:hypothetical protein
VVVVWFVRGKFVRFGFAEDIGETFVDFRKERGRGERFVLGRELQGV